MMKKWMEKQPITFSLMTMVLMIIVTILTYPLFTIFGKEAIEIHYGGTLSRGITIAVLLLLVWRSGILQRSGIVAKASIKAWLITFSLLVYLVVIQMLIFTGSFKVDISNRSLSFALALSLLAGSIVEEILFRGIIFTTLRRKWQSTLLGLHKAALVSACFFGMIHLLNIGTRSFPLVMAQSLVVILPGYVYALITFYSKSLWPAIFLHWLTNLAVNLALHTRFDYQESLSMWFLFAIGLIPIVVYCIWLLKSWYAKKEDMIKTE